MDFIEKIIRYLEKAEEHELERLRRIICKPKIHGYRIRQLGVCMTPMKGAGSFYPKSEPTPTPAVEEKPAVSETQQPVTGIVPGATGTFVADPVDASGNVITDPAVISGVKLTWTSADTTNEPVTSSGNAGDFGATITVPTSAPANATGAALSVSDGTFSGTVDVPVLAPAPPPTPQIAGYVIRQTS